MQAWEEQHSFRAIVEEDATVASTLTKEELDSCFDYRYHLKHVDTIFSAAWVAVILVVYRL